MISPEYRKLLADPRWKAKREEIHKRSGGKCEKCGSDHYVQTHHPHYERGNKPWEYDDLIDLCAKCHRQADWERKSQNQTRHLERDVLAGKYFHSLDESRHICWQGKVLGRAEPGFYLVQLFSWADGENSNAQIVAFEEMFEWLFYQSPDEMIHSYDYGQAHRLKAPLTKQQ